MIKWLYTMYWVRKYYKELMFAPRQRFIRELRPFTSDGCRIAYPDAIFFVTMEDVTRASVSLLQAEDHK